MTNVSKKKTTEKDYVLVHNELITLITKLTTKTAPYLLNELLTESERIMIIKRFGAIFMFTQSYTPYRVSRTLGISLPTTSRLYKQYSSGNFSNLFSSTNRKERSRLFSLLEDLILAQASPRARARLLNRVL